MFKQSGEERAAGAVFPGQRIGILQLPEDLWLAKHHGVQAGGHSHHVPDGIAIAVHVQRFFQFRGVHSMEAGHPAKHHGGAVIIAGQVQLGPVTGRQYRRLGGA